MASYGFLGAVGGASKSVSDAMLMKMEEAKAGRLAELRGGVDRETNSLNNEQRHENATAQQAQGHENSLAELKQRNTDLTGQKQTDIDNEPTFTSKHDATGKLTGQVNDRTNEWSRAGESSGVRGGSAPSDQQMIEYLINTHKLDPKEAREKILNRSGTDKGEFRRQVMLKMIGTGMYDASDPEFQSQLDSQVSMGYPEQKPNGGGGGRTYQEYFDALTAKNSDKYSPEQIQDYIKGKYGLQP